jgi:tripartite-type tricarboxylate transporter receptor subunit TctC
MEHTNRIPGLALAVGIAIASPMTCAQNFPERAIRLVVGYAPGGTTDFAARIVAPELSAALGQSVVVDNRPGAGSIIGTEIVAKASADGYTLLLPDTTFAIVPAIYAKRPFDAIRDFAPITHIMSVANCLAVNPSLPARTMQDLVALARAKPNTLTFGSGGVGTPLHMTGELFKIAAKIDIVHVPYKGAGPALTELMGGQLTMIFPTLTNVLPFIKGGKLRALAVTSAQRSPALSDVPTTAEAGYPALDVTSWFGLVAPKGTPKKIIEQLHSATTKILSSPEVRARFQTQQAVVVGSSPEEFARLLAGETAKWVEIAKNAKIRVE